MKVVVAGGSGFVGRPLCERLVAAGHDVVILTRDPVRARAPAGFRLLEWHPPARGPWTRELADAGAVVNLAGESVGRWPWTPARKRALRASRLVPTRALVDAMADLPPDRRPGTLLNASGTDVYLDLDAEPATEDAAPADSFLSRLCVAWEHEAVRTEELGLRVVLLRLSLVVARDAPSLRLLALPFRLFVGGRIGSGQQWMSWVDRDDAIGLIEHALVSHDLRGPLNLAAPDPRRQADFGRALAGALRRPCWFTTPAWAVRLVLGEQAVLALGSRRVWPARGLASGYVFSHDRLEPSLERALR